MLEEESRQEGTQSRDGTAESRPQRDRLRPAGPRPQRGDERKRRGERHACRESAAQPRDEQHGVGRSPRSQETHGYRKGGADQQHRLAPVAVSQRAEVQHRARESKRVPNRDQVQRGLRGLEGGADRWKSDVGHRQVQVGDGGDQDQRDENQRAVLGDGRSRDPTSIRIGAHPMSSPNDMVRNPSRRSGSDSRLCRRSDRDYAVSMRRSVAGETAR